MSYCLGMFVDQKSLQVILLLITLVRSNAKALIPAMRMMLCAYGVRTRTCILQLYQF